LYFNTSMTRWDWVLPNKRILLGNSLNDLYAEFTLQQLLYNGGKTGIQSDLAHTLVETESVTRQRLQQAIVYSVARAYLLLLKAERLVGVQELAIENLREHVTTAELLYRSGKVSQLDVLKAQTQIALANEELVKAKNSVTVRRQEIFGAMGVDTVYDFRTVDLTEALWQREQLRSLREDSLLSLLNRHPDLQRAELDIQEREQEISLAQTDYYPSVFVRGSYNWEDSRVFPGNKNWNIGVGLSLPLFQGGATQASVDQAKSRTEAARATEEALRQRIQVAVRTNLTTLDDTRSRVRSAAEIVRLAEESEKVASLKYRTGKGTNLDVLDAEMVLTNARINYIQVLTDYAVAIAELNFNLGSAEVPFHE
jgi:outer membrane protein TolC